ncbi:MAG: DNA primase [Parasphingorhabdus sp.]
MSLSTAFLDELRTRNPLSGLVGQSVKLTKAGREHKGCCPFHSEKTASFTVNDDKQFYHCFGCGAHGDAFRWLTDHDGMAFMDAVRQLADAAGMQVPARSPEAAAAAARIDGLRPALEAAQGLYQSSLKEYENVAALSYLTRRGVGLDMIEQFGIGYAPEARDHLKELGLSLRAALDSGLAWRNEDSPNGNRAHGERFRGRIMIPVHNARGQLIGFGGRKFADHASGPAKYINSPDSEIFDKGRTLYNLHRAAPLARAKAGNTGRLIVVEGYMDVIAMAAAGIGETVAPMGTALTREQIKLLWRVHVSPILLLDGDSAGQRAAIRACETALAMAGPTGTLRVAMLPDGCDPDDLLQEKGRDAVEAVLEMARPLSDFLFDAVLDEIQAQVGSPLPPEAVAAIWNRLEGLTESIEDDETRAQYQAVWLARFNREVSAVHSVVKDRALDVYTKAEDGDYVWPETEDESERKLIMIVARMLELREQRRELSQTIADVRSMAKAIGFDGKTLTACCVAIEMDPSSREDSEMLLALYRKVLGIKGPMDEALLPSLSGFADRAGFADRRAIEGRVRDPQAVDAPRHAVQRLAWASIGENR